MDKTELSEILAKHKKWLENSNEGARADLSGANLSGANLSWANLSGANLSWANLSGANLSGVKKDFFTRLNVARSEVIGLYDALQRGKIDGSCYEGDCACFVGTIANLRHENYQDLKIDLSPDSDSPTERWFLAIQPGQVPSSSQIVKITSEWIEEFCKEEGIILPTYELVAKYPSEIPQPPTNEGEG